MDGRRRLMLFAASAALLEPALAAEDSRVVYPRHLRQQDRQVDYFVTLMQLALAHSGRRYTLQATPSSMVQSRALIELAGEHPSVDVYWTMSDTAREQSLLPVRIPLLRGLIGWRLALVRRADRERFSEVCSLKDLASYTAGQMHDWPDTQILRANGLPVTTSTHYQGLFQMLDKGRIDYFPRSIMEIDAELTAYPELDLTIDPHLLLHYPAALYFFVRPGRPQLAADLRRGMEKLVADGTLEHLSRAEFGSLLQRHRVAQRRVLRLHNPMLAPLTPLQRKELWFPLPN